MIFAQKLVFLMALTSTSNKQLAEAVRVDASLISRLRNARRTAPKNRTYIKAMADYFARKCEGNYQRIALAEAMGRKNLEIQMDAAQRSSMLYDWLADGRDQAGQLQNASERFAIAEPNPRSKRAQQRPLHKPEAGIFAYYGSEGKRGALSALFAHLRALDTPATIHLSADEGAQWLYEEPDYLAQLVEQLSGLIKKGFRICRIGAPLVSADQAFNSFSRWLPLHMTGQVEAFFYPRLRDELHRRTLIVIPDVAALVSSSVAAQESSRVTLLTFDRRLTNAFMGEFQDILRKCQPMTIAHSGAGDMEELLRCIGRLESDRGDRIQQSTSLSYITAPPALVERALQGASAQRRAAASAWLEKARSLFRHSLTDYETVDIHSVASPQEVRVGVVPIAAGYFGQQSAAFYTVQEYAAHLKSILHHLALYENYHAVLLPRGASTHAVMVKQGRQALLLRPGVPLMLYEACQPGIAEACREYLLRLMPPAPSPAIQRRQTIASITELLGALGCEA